jgi:ABC-type multidrug transport system fused ATPase/permease subunit
VTIERKKARYNRTMERTVEAAPAYSNVALARDIWVFLRPYKWKFLLVTTLRLIGDIARLYPAIALAQIVSFLGSYSSGQSLVPLAQAIVLAGIAHCIHISGRQSAKIIGIRLAERMCLMAQLQTMRHLFLLDLSWHEQENSGNKLKRMQKGADGLNLIFRMWINSFIEIAVNFVGITIILATFDVHISIAMVCFMIVYLLVSHFFVKRAVMFAHQVNIGEEDIQGLEFETIHNIRSIKVLGMSSSLEERLREKIDDVFANIRQRVFWYQSRDWVLVMMANAFALSMVTFIAIGIIAGRYEIGLLVLFMEYFRKIWELISEFSNVLQDFVTAKYSVLRMRKILEEPVGIDANEGKQEFPKAWDTISMRNVSFGYTKDQPILRSISITIRRGEKIGIVGLSGAGKSTLFKLLLKEHEDYDGDIVIGATRLRDIKRTEFFRHSAVVLQETEVFNFTLKDNITLANPQQSENTDLIDQTIATAHVKDFLARLPQGLETLIGEKGFKLSGGEKQRVGIARAIFKKPDILFLDEATSHLDLESEEKIRDSLHQFFQSVTAIVIAHRLTTIKEMDRILVIENGTIIEEGSFEELLKKKGRFFELWERQKF